MGATAGPFLWCLEKEESAPLPGALSDEHGAASLRREGGTALVGCHAGAPQKSQRTHSLQAKHPGINTF